MAGVNARYAVQGLRRLNAAVHDAVKEKRQILSSRDIVHCCAVMDAMQSTAYLKH